MKDWCGSKGDISDESYWTPRPTAAMQDEPGSMASWLARLLGIHAALPGGHDDVVQLRRVQAVCIQPQVQVHEAGVERRFLHAPPLS